MEIPGGEDQSRSAAFHLQRGFGAFLTPKEEAVRSALAIFANSDRHIEATTTDQGAGADAHPSYGGLSREASGLSYVWAAGQDRADVLVTCYSPVAEEVPGNNEREACRLTIRRERFS